jgi:antirestriction protein
MRAIIAWQKMCERHTLEHVKERIEYVQQLLESEDIIRKFPEDVTDDYKAAARDLRAAIDPDYLP